jgi:hypothetical protein
MGAQQHPGGGARKGRAVLLVCGGVLVLVGIAMAFGPVVVDRGICAFAPCDPGTPTVGFRSEEGATVAEIGPLSGSDVRSIEVRAPDGTDFAENGEVLWRIESVDGDGVPDGSIVLGEDRDGFRTDVPLRQPIPAGAVVDVSNGCYIGSGFVPARLSEDRVASEFGQESIRSFNENDIGFTECDEPMSGGVRLLMLIGVIAAGVGLGLSLAGLLSGPRGGGGRPRRNVDPSA